ncbi:MAG: MlaD family protein [bacterium]|nr:MlaD family protein [bacterium]
MGIERSDKVKAALFLLVTVLLFTGLVIGLIGTAWLQPKDHYYVDFDIPVKGLNSGSAVRLNGVPVGKVVRFGKAPNGRTTRVTIAVARGTAIHEDSVATLELESLIVGNRAINISLGSPSARRLQPNNQNPRNIIRGTQSDFDVMASTVVDIARMTTGLIQNINNIFSPENAAQLSSILTQLNQFMATNSTVVPATLEKFGSMMDTTQVKIAQLQIEELQNELRATLAMINEATRTANETVTQNQRAINDTLNNIRSVTDALRELIERLNRQPGILVRGAREREREKEWSDE